MFLLSNGPKNKNLCLLSIGKRQDSPEWSRVGSGDGKVRRELHRLHKELPSCNTTGNLGNRCLNRSGFSLVEMILAMAILAIALGSMMVILSGALSIVKKSREVVIATNLARREIEFLKNVHFPPINNDRSDAMFNVEGEQADYERPRYQAYGTDFDVVVTTKSAGAIDAGAPGKTNDVLKEVTVKVSRTGTTEAVVTLKTYFARNGI